MEDLIKLLKLGKQLETFLNRRPAFVQTSVSMSKFSLGLDFFFFFGNTGLKGYRFLSLTPKRLPSLTTFKKLKLIKIS